MDSGTSTIPLGQYLFKRVAQLGVKHVMGVPGDFNRECCLAMHHLQSSMKLEVTWGSSSDPTGRTV